MFSNMFCIEGNVYFNIIRHICITVVSFRGCECNLIDQLST